MNDENRKLLEEEIRLELGCLADMEVGTEEYKTTVDGLTKLIDRATELKKIDIDIKEKAKNDDFRQKQISNEKRNRVIDNSIAIAGIVVPSVITIWGTFKTLKFEETGTITTIMGRGFINKLLPKR